MYIRHSFKGKELRSPILSRSCDPGFQVSWQSFHECFIHERGSYTFSAVISQSKRDTSSSTAAHVFYTIIMLIYQTTNNLKQTYVPFSEQWRIRTSVRGRPRFQTVTRGCSSSWSELWRRRWQKWQRMCTLPQAPPYNNRLPARKHSDSPNCEPSPRLSVPWSYRLSSVITLLHRTAQYKWVAPSRDCTWKVSRHLLAMFYFAMQTNVKQEA